MFDTVFPEIVRQSQLFDFDSSIFIKYVGDFVSNCLIPSQAINFTDCSNSIVATESYTFSIDIGNNLINNDPYVFKSTLAAQTLRRPLQQSKTKNRFVSINGEILEVNSIKERVT